MHKQHILYTDMKCVYAHGIASQNGFVIVFGGPLSLAALPAYEAYRNI